MAEDLNRRKFLAFAGAGFGASVTGARSCFADSKNAVGYVVGDAFGQTAGQRVLEEGGNAVDAIVAAAFVASVTSLSNCGIGGYGGHLVVGLANGETSSVDFNGTAPSAMNSDMFKKAGLQKGYLQRGWLSAGVPGVLGGLQLAIDQFGSRTISDLMQPAISIARDGFELPTSTARTIQRLQGTLRKDPGAARLLLPSGKPPLAGSNFRNPDLADLLSHLAESGSVDPFYRGDIAKRIASEFQNNGGLVTFEDMKSYRARLVQPEHLRLQETDIYTAPLTAGGVTCLQVLKIIDRIGLDQFPADSERSHARLEAQRIAWTDRLNLFGDPEFVDVHLEEILSDESITRQARKVEYAVKQKKRILLESKPTDHGGTCHLSSVDREGNLASLTFTHGQGFGSGVSVDGLGLILGHGISRFDPDPNHPNSPGPRKRPLNNMCPTIVSRSGQPVIALGGRGGRRIPNAVLYALTHFLSSNGDLDEAIAGERLHTEGDDSVILQGQWSQQTRDYFASLGYHVTNGSVARLDAASFDPK